MLSRVCWIEAIWFAFTGNNNFGILQISLVLVLATLLVLLPLSAFAKGGDSVGDYVDAIELAEIIRLSNNLDSCTTDIEDVDDFVLSENDTDEIIFFIEFFICNPALAEDKTDGGLNIVD